MLDSSNCMLDCSDDTQPCKAFCVLESMVEGARHVFVNRGNACGEVEQSGGPCPTLPASLDPSVSWSTRHFTTPEQRPAD